jgi:hypothetical protein
MRGRWPPPGWKANTGRDWVVLLSWPHLWQSSLVASLRARIPWMCPRCHPAPAEQWGLGGHNHHAERHQQNCDSWRQQNPKGCQDASRKGQGDHVVAHGPREILDHSLLWLACLESMTFSHYVHEVVLHQDDAGRFRRYLGTAAKDDAQIRAGASFTMHPIPAVRLSHVKPEPGLQPMPLELLT